VIDSSGVPIQQNILDAFVQMIAQQGTFGNPSPSTNNRLRNTKERDASIDLDNDGVTRPTEALRMAQMPQWRELVTFSAGTFLVLLR